MTDQATVQIDLRVLHAVSLMASKEETRFYLNGVYVEAFKDHVKYVATDGHRMVAVRVAIASPETVVGPLLGSWVVPTEICRAYKPKKYKNVIDDTAILSRDGDADLRLQQVGCTCQVFKPIDGTFLDWTRVIPGGLGQLTGLIDYEEKSGPRGIMFNSAYIADFAKFGAMMESGLPRLAFNSGGPAAVIFNDSNILAVIMPMRCDTQAELQAAWAVRRATVLGYPTEDKPGG